MFRRASSFTGFYWVRGSNLDFFMILSKNDFLHPHRQEVISTLKLGFFIRDQSYDSWHAYENLDDYGFCSLFSETCQDYVYRLLLYRIRLIVLLRLLLLQR